MKYSAFLCNLLCLGCLAQPQPFPLNQEQETERTNNLIISYDPTQTDAETLIDYTGAQGATLIYRYNIINAIAVRVPEHKDYRQMQALFQRQKGVLQVSEDQIIRFDPVIKEQ